MSEQVKKKTVKPWQAMLMLILGIAIIFIGLKMGINNRIILLFDGVLMCVLSCCFGIRYDDLQADMKATISSMLVAILILIAVGVLVGTWMISGTVPVMIYYGMKVLTPGLFLPIVCVVCTLMSTMAGTSWGTLATVGVAFMGVAQGLGVPLPVTAGAIVVGAFFGDKISPLSDSPVLVSSVTEVPLMEGIKHALLSTGPAYLVSLVFLSIYGLRFGGGTVGGETYEAILSTVTSQFNLSPLLLLPPIVVVVLIVLKKPTLPTFTAGIFVAVVLAMVLQGENVHSVASAMYGGFVSDTGVEVVDSMLTRGPPAYRRRGGYPVGLCAQDSRKLQNHGHRRPGHPRAVLHHYRSLLCLLPCGGLHGEGYVPGIRPGQKEPDAHHAGHRHGSRAPGALGHHWSLCSEHPGH